MKLEVGQFARLKSGYIVKVLNVKDDWIETDTKFITRTFPKDFVKASYNIIEILKEGDYVNGCKVIKNTLKDGGNIVIVQGGNCFTNEEIKSVITHEQMEQIAYKVSD